MEYSGQFLYPPRPEVAISVDQITVLERKGYWAQIKKNGTSNVIMVGADDRRMARGRVNTTRAIQCFNRHRAEHKVWELTVRSAYQFQRLPGAGAYVFAAELLHSKVRGLRDTNYIYDILVNDGEYLVGREFRERQQILRRLFLRGKNARLEPNYSHYELDPHTWLARCHDDNLSLLFNGLIKPEDEGLVLKDPRSQLSLCGRPESNRSWQVKCRRNDISPNFTM